MHLPRITCSKHISLLIFFVLSRHLNGARPACGGSATLARGCCFLAIFKLSSLSETLAESEVLLIQCVGLALGGEGGA